MNSRQLFDALISAKKLGDVREAIETFKQNGNVKDVPFGARANNRGAIDVATDPARSAIERVTNAHDAVLELEHSQHGGVPVCRSPREAADAWLGVPLKDGLSGLTPKERQALSQRTIVRLEPGEGWQSRILTVLDRGIGIDPTRMKDTILSLNESNKIQKHYLAGTYGQGGSSTLAFSRYVLIATRAHDSDAIGFTVAYFEDLPADEYKSGRYAYLVEGSDVLAVRAKDGDFPHGTLIRHFGYDLSSYTASIGPKSLYGALQRVLFDPVAPIRFENEVAKWNRTIKGSRNALNGAVDQGDDENKGPDLDHNMPMFYVKLGDLGDVGIEYWVLSRPKGKATGKPSRSHVDDAKPIIFTHNGQNQGELSGRLIKKDADLPYLQTQGRLIVHVNCDRLSASAKRFLFASTREQSREGHVQTAIQNEIIDLLKSDDELKRLNEEAREQSLKEKDDEAEKQMQRQVAKLLRLVGPALVDVSGSKKSASGDGTDKPSRKPRKPAPIETKEPPTYVKIVADKDEELTFYAGQRKYIRIETDANSKYHDPSDPAKSKFNIAVGNDLKVFGTSPLRGGRMRIGVQCNPEVAIGTVGSIRIELYRPGLPTLSDEQNYKAVEPPKPKDEQNKKSAFPEFKVVAVDGPDDEGWEYISEDPDDRNIHRHASGTERSGGVQSWLHNFGR